MRKTVGQQGASEGRLHWTPQRTSRQTCVPRAGQSRVVGRALGSLGPSPGFDATLLWARGKSLSFSELSPHL